jgi:hypothetical protein
VRVAWPGSGAAMSFMATPIMLRRDPSSRICRALIRRRGAHVSLGMQRLGIERKTGWPRPEQAGAERPSRFMHLT